MLRAMSSHGPDEQHSPSFGGTPFGDKGERGEPSRGDARGDARSLRPRRGAPPVQVRSGEPRVRRGTIRLPADVGWRLRAGHPWVFRDTLGGRPLRDAPGEIVELVTPEGDFVARGLYDPDGPIAVRVLTRDPNELIDEQALLNRVRSGERLRATLLPKQGLTAYRVIHGEGDFLPGVTVDRYADFLVVHLYTAAWEPHVKALLNALEAVHKPTAIYVQKRFRPLGGEGPKEPAELVRGAVAPIELEVQEGPLRIAVDVTAPLGTGLFPDLRLGRQSVTARAAGRRVLNLFSYTGALSLAAAAGRATEVVSVDLSPKAHARARRNLQLSGLSETGHEFITGDVMSVLARMAERKRRFDMIIIDPPAFAQGGAGRGQTFSVARDYRELLAEALQLAEQAADHAVLLLGLEDEVVERLLRLEGLIEHDVLGLAVRQQFLLQLGDEAGACRGVLAGLHPLEQVLDGLVIGLEQFVDACLHGVTMARARGLASDLVGKLAPPRRRPASEAMAALRTPAGRRVRRISALALNALTPASRRAG